MHGSQTDISRVKQHTNIRLQIPLLLGEVSTLDLLISLPSCLVCSTQVLLSSALLGPRAEKGLGQVKGLGLGTLMQSDQKIG